MKRTSQSFLIAFLAPLFLVFACDDGSDTGQPESDESSIVQGKVPPLNEEASLQEQAGEEKEFERLAREINELQDRRAAANGGVSRGFHVKPHACALGELRVLSERSEETRYGVFEEETTYPAWVRLSNAQSVKQSDRQPDIRGLAVKLLGVEGPKLMDGQEDAQTQDFLTVNAPTLGARSATEFMEFQKAITSGGFAALKFFATHPRLAADIAKFTGHQVSSMLTEKFYSGVPYKLGPRAIKYAFWPCEGIEKPDQILVSDTYLRKDAHDTIRSDGACYDLLVQFQRDPVKQPVEDSSAEWKESEAPFERVAQLVIPPHDLDSEAGQREEAYCEKLTWNPWHSVEEHRPIGNANRARRVVMRAAQKHRGVPQPPKEPEGVERF